MAHVYADLATLKSASALNVPDDAHDARLLALLEAASRWMDGFCDRAFGPVAARREFDGNGSGMLLVPDLASVGSLSTAAGGGRWTDWPAGDWLLYPRNAEPTRPGGRPYTRVVAADGAGRRFPSGRANIMIDGIWGYGNVAEDAGWRVGRAGLDAVATEVALTAAAGPGAIAPGHTVLIDDEQMLVIKGQAAAGDATATLTAQRGANGTAALAHEAGAIVSAYRYPAAVAEACLVQAAAWWRQRAGAPFALPPESSGGEWDGVDATARRLLEPYRRRAAALGV